MPAVSKFIDGTGPVFWKLIPVLIYYYCLWCSVWIPCSRFIRYDAEDDRARGTRTANRLWSNVNGVVCSDDGDDCTCVLTPGTYFAINSPRLIGTDVSQASSYFLMGICYYTNELKDLAVNVGEQTILSRTGGAPTLAIGMAYIFTSNRWNGHDGILVSFCDSL